MSWWVGGWEGEWELCRELDWKLYQELAFLRILRGRLRLGELLVYEGRVGLLWSGFSLGLTPSVAG